ncbi:MAG TPA: prolyl oligopeptidase family serine peptidase [Acidimicrobiales bacterium]|nr:prolyl oligopeptidase family serine peptidase [Acidimicrobiales bacterium]
MAFAPDAALVAPTVVARRDDTVDDYHGDLVADPYRWLETTDDPETRAWITAQNARTEAWLDGVEGREAIAARLAELWDYPKRGVPFERGGRWFQLRNTGLQNQAVLWTMDGPTEEGRVLLDPNALAADGTVALTALAVTDDGALLAYATSQAGSDWRTWRVRQVEGGGDLPDVVAWSKYGTAAWRRDGSGFYHVQVDRPRAGAEYLERAGAMRVMFHRLGTPQEADELVFADEDPESTLAVEVTEDGRFVVVTVAHGTAPEARLYVLDLEDPGGEVRPLVAEAESKVAVVTTVGATFLLVTDDGAERQRLVAVDLGDPRRAAWREVVPEAEAVLLGARHCGGRLVCHYLERACSRLSVRGLDGADLGHLEVPAVASLVAGPEGSWVEGRPDSPLVHFGLTSFTDSGSVWSHDLDTGATRCVSPPAAAVDPEAVVSEQVLVEADDGVLVPLFLTRRRDVVPDGDVPVLLYGYGGFDVAVTPAFSVSWSVFVERGGMVAVAVLRGGGEFGRSWHRAGMLGHKQRVFDDCCDCARWLVTSGWTRPGRIAVNGASNGGLLVGACLTQHPELFGAAVAEVGVLDMLRFDRFTIGWAWKSDFGDPADPEQYRTLRAYSPLHHVTPGRAYPPTLLTTGDHDDRVVPGHSFKFAATMQAAQAPGSGPTLIRVDTATGHGLGRPTAKAVAERADVLAFLEGALGPAG